MKFSEYISVISQQSSRLLRNTDRIRIHVKDLKGDPKNRGDVVNLPQFNEYF
jgi:hypothetical protein